MKDMYKCSNEYSSSVVISKLLFILRWWGSFFSLTGLVCGLLVSCALQQGGTINELMAAVSFLVLCDYCRSLSFASRHDFMVWIPLLEEDGHASRLEKRPRLLWSMMVLDGPEFCFVFVSPLWCYLGIIVSRKLVPAEWHWPSTAGGLRPVCSSKGAWFYSGNCSML